MNNREKCLVLIRALREVGYVASLGVDAHPCSDDDEEHTPEDYYVGLGRPQEDTFDIAFYPDDLAIQIVDQGLLSQNGEGYLEW